MADLVGFATSAALAAWRFAALLCSHWFWLFFLLLIKEIYGSEKDENTLFKAVVTKILCWVDALIFMVASKDSKGVGQKKAKDPDNIKARLEQGLGLGRKKQIIFIRHGESDWNNIFNKGKNLQMFVKIASAWFKDLTLFAANDSVFLDSPLNEDGIKQAVDFSEFLQASGGNQTDDELAKLMDLLSGRDSSVSSVIVSSNLRRAISTTTLCLWPRIEKTSEKIMILSSLQEISRNVDTYALAATMTVPDLPFSRIAPHCGGDKFSPEAIFDASGNAGNKTLTFYGIKRFEAFNNWVFERDEEVIIVGGHSLWFKHFFQTYLPHKSMHEAKTKKIENSGAVAFALHSCILDDGSVQYRADPDSIRNIYGGFTSK